MNIRDTQRAVVIERLSSHLLEHGLAQTSLRQLATAAEVSDRMLLYYFADKAEVLTTTLSSVAQGLVTALDAALPDERVAPEVLLTRALALMRSPIMLPSVRLWLEIVIAAARKQAPFPQLAASIMEGFLGWLEQRLDIADDQQRAETAAHILATVDGIALFDLVGRPDLANAAQALTERGGTTTERAT